MPGIARVGRDTAGGLIAGGGNDKVLVEGFPAAVIGDAVVGHGPGPHGGPVMAFGSTRVRANGKPICRAGDAASCGDVATGSSKASAG